MLGCFCFMQIIKPETEWFMAGVADGLSRGLVKPLTQEYFTEMFENFNAGRVVVGDKFDLNTYAAGIHHNVMLAKEKEAKRKVDIDDIDFNAKYPNSHTYIEEGFEKVESDFDLQCNVKRFMALRDKILEKEKQDILILLRECYLDFSPLYPVTKLGKLSKKYKKLEDVLHDLLTAGVPMSEVFPDVFE